MTVTKGISLAGLSDGSVGVAGPFAAHPRNINAVANNIEIPRPINLGSCLSLLLFLLLLVIPFPSTE
jgi:hypothetical protein